MVDTAGPISPAHRTGETDSEVRLGDSIVKLSEALLPSSQPKLELKQAELASFHVDPITPPQG